MTTSTENGNGTIMTPTADTGAGRYFTYAIADLHGRFDLLQKAYDAISEHADGRPGIIVHLGDYVDRGPQSRQIIEWLMDDPALPPGWRRVCLKGNHEDMMVETLSEPLDPAWWVGNGGSATLASYDGNVPPQHIAWMNGLPSHYEDAHRVFVHAGVDPTKPMAEQTEAMLLWYRYPTGADVGLGGKHVVHGHTPNPRGPELFTGRTNLDTFAWKTGRLVVAVFDSKVAGGPARLIEVSDSKVTSP